MSGRRFGCSHLASVVPGLPNCCISCHEDCDEYGYAMLEQYDGDDVLEICCALGNYLDPARKADGSVYPWSALRGLP